MTERVEQRICIKFCQKLGHTCSETIRMIRKVYGDDSMSNTQIKEWYKRFKDGRVSVDSDYRSGRPSTSRTVENVERIQAAINKNCRLTVRELEDLVIPKTTIAKILTEDLGMSRVKEN
ncbi:protein GVQW3-like [Frieseomelitta varia]|uniref:protein GVQW3-like n=1 Tax=Frieseomelitta varia TaxID=561572 RepID=UPI001CB6A243|nr:protein GVQW3-like [Frieseomelitta varia]